MQRRQIGSVYVEEDRWGTLSAETMQFWTVVAKAEESAVGWFVLAEAELVHGWCWEQALENCQGYLLMNPALVLQVAIKFMG